MVVKLPYMALPSAIPKILAKIDEAKRPERFTQDFLATMLGFSGGNHQAFLPMLKRMNFLEQDGTPTKLYDQYRNDDTKAMALAAGVRSAYSAIFDRNQYANNLTREKLASLVTEMTGQAKDISRETDRYYFLDFKGWGGFREQIGRRKSPSGPS